MRPGGSRATGRRPLAGVAGRRAAAPLVGVRRKSAPEGLQEDFQVEGERPALDVVEVVLEALLERGVAPPPVDLGPPGHAGLDLVAEHVPGQLAPKLLHEHGPLRARADQAHLAPQNVHELGKLVEAEAPEPGAERGPSRIAGLRPHRTAFGLGAGTHRPEVEHRKGATVQAHPLLAQPRPTMRTPVSGRPRTAATIPAAGLPPPTMTARRTLWPARRAARRISRNVARQRLTATIDSAQK